MKIQCSKGGAHGQHRKVRAQGVSFLPRSFHLSPSWLHCECLRSGGAEGNGGEVESGCGLTRCSWEEQRRSDCFSAVSELEQAKQCLNADFLTPVSKFLI